MKKLNSACSERIVIMTNSEDIKQKLEMVKTSIGVHPDFPKPGIVFRDIFSVFRDREAYVSLLEIMKSHSQSAAEKGVQAVAALESRGFLFGPQIALDIGVPFFPIRKKGKLPGKTVSVEYSLEYGKDAFEAQKDSIQAGDKILIVDDLLATGGSLVAACDLIKKLGGEVIECLVVMELVDLKGRDHIPAPVTSLIQF